MTPDEQVNLHADLDLYFGSVAGYSYRPDHLGRRPRAELVKAQSFLSTSFFDQHPQYKAHASHVSSETTPELHYELALADMNRADLLLLINELLQCEHHRAVRTHAR